MVEGEVGKQRKTFVGASPTPSCFRGQPELSRLDCRNHDSDCRNKEARYFQARRSPDRRVEEHTRRSIRTEAQNDEDQARSQPRATDRSASWGVALARSPQVALLIHFRQFPQAGLQFLPGRYSLARGRCGLFGHIVAGGLAFLAAVADLQVGPVLGPAALTMAAGAAAGAIGFRQRTENGNLGQTFDLAQQAAPLR